jgi:hypothetical protein
MSSAKIFAKSFSSPDEVRTFGKNVLNHSLKQIVAKLHIQHMLSLEELKLGWTMVQKLKVDQEILR